MVVIPHNLLYAFPYVRSFTPLIQMTHQCFDLFMSFRLLCNYLSIYPHPQEDSHLACGDVYDYGHKHKLWKYGFFVYWSTLVPHKLDQTFSSTLWMYAWWHYLKMSIYGWKSHLVCLDAYLDTHSNGIEYCDKEWWNVSVAHNWHKR